MGRQDELKAFNNPVDNSHFVFDINGTILNYAPDGWDDDEFTMKRDMKLFGVFDSFTTSELKFVKDGRDLIISIYEAGGVNANAILTVTEYDYTRISRVRFVGKVDFSTIKITEISADVQIKDNSFTDLILTRAKTDVNLLSLVDVDNNAILPADTRVINLPALNIDQVANFDGDDYSSLLPSDHNLQFDLVSSDFDEANRTTWTEGKFFDAAIKDYIGLSFDVHIEAVTSAAITVNHDYFFIIERWNNGSKVDEIFSQTANNNKVDTLNFTIDEQFNVNILTGDYLIFEVLTIDAWKTLRYKNINISMQFTVSALPARDITMFLNYEAYTRLINIYTGQTDKFKSDFFGRLDLGYLQDGISSGAVTIGRFIRQLTGLNNNMTVSLEKLFNSHQAQYCLGLGIENDKIVIEPMEYFFNSNVILNISDRIASETIVREYFPELAFNRISVGYANNETNVLGGIYEYNTTSKFTTVIKNVDHELNLVSPYRADISGVIALITEPVENKDVSGDNDVFLIDTIKDGTEYRVRTSEGFTQADDLGNTDTLINLAVTPKRNLLRWGGFIRGFADKYLTSSIIFQGSNKNTRLKSTETGKAQIVESDNVLVSDLIAPLWIPEIVSFEVPVKYMDLPAIQANKYGIVKYSADGFGWIISYKSKNENGKSEFVLLRCNMDYITPVGDVVFPATITISKTVSNDLTNDTDFFVNITGDSGFTANDIPIKSGQEITINNIPFGNYSITENAVSGFTLTGITPETFEISISNLHVNVDIVNQKAQGLELTFDSILNVPVADPANVADWNTFFDLPNNGGVFTSVEVVGDMVRLMGGDLNYMSLSNVPLLQINGLEKQLNLGNIELFETLLTTLPTCPEIAYHIFCANGQLNNIQNLQQYSQLITLSVGQNQLTSIPALPESLRDLHCAINLLTVLPNFPNSLIFFNCFNNLLSVLPEFPTNATYLIFNNNKLSTIPNLPNTVEHIVFNSNQLPISEIDRILNELITLNPTNLFTVQLKYQTPPAPPTPSVKSDFIAQFPSVILYTD